MKKITKLFLIGIGLLIIPVIFEDFTRKVLWDDKRLQS